MMEVKRQIYSFILFKDKMPEGDFSHDGPFVGTDILKDAQ